MSSQAQGEGAQAPKRRGLGRYVQRMRAVFRTGARNQNQTTTPAESSSSRPAQTSATTAAAPKPITPMAKAEEAPLQPGVVTVNRAQIERERARKLAEKYGLTIEPYEWAASCQTVQRIEKPIRMRIHRTCHKCKATFGIANVCVKCEHVRCKQCPRYPPRKDKSSKDVGKGKGVAGAGAPVAAGGAGGLPAEWKKLALKKPSRTGGQDLVRKKPKQRVRRHCHDCATQFIPGNKTCPGCGHIRCVECPRDPAKKHLYPDGYPGDAPAPDTIPADKIKHPTRFKCHSCNTVLARGSMTCGNCGHEKCAQCPRVPPKKLKHREFDADVLRQVEERLAALTASTAARAGAKSLSG